MVRPAYPVDQGVLRPDSRDDVDPAALPYIYVMKKTKSLPYWLSDGSETCALCTHRYVLQMEYRCTACDRGVCEHCAVVIRETRELLCTDCQREEE